MWFRKNPRSFRLSQRFLTAVASMALLDLSGCAPLSQRVDNDGPDAQGYVWQKASAPLAVIVHPDQDVLRRCGYGALACAVRNQAARVCHIYLPRDSEPWMKAHELRHCDGWNHYRLYVVAKDRPTPESVHLARTTE